MQDKAQLKKNLWFFPLGTVGRDMIYNLFTNFILVFIMCTKQLDEGQLAAITGIMIGARVFDALNDPIMGNIIERTRTRFGKFKPWLLIGILTTSVVVYLAFNTSLTGWSFVVFFGFIYFMYSLTFTMHDISYWGMIPALSQDGSDRDKFTSRASFFAGIGSTLVSLLVPMFTAGALTIGGSAATAYGRIALVVCILAPLFLMFTLIGVKEKREAVTEPAPRISFKKITSTIFGNRELRWMSIIFLLQQIGGSFAFSGVATFHVYFRYGYEGGLYSIFSTVGVAATAVLMLLYPLISKKLKRKQFLKVLMIICAAGCALELLSGFLPAGSPAFAVLVIGFMAANFGTYGFYLVMMISIINTVEYNEYTKGTRDEAIISSVRPFVTKLGSAICVALTSLTYIIFRVVDYTNKISEYENLVQQNLMTEEEKLSSVNAVISEVSNGQTIGLVAALAGVQLLFTLAAYLLYRKKYTLDEEEYDRICQELNAGKKAPGGD